MSRGAKIATNIGVTVALLCYIVWSIVLTRQESEQALLQHINVVVEDSAVCSFVTEFEVRSAIKDSLYKLRTPLGEVSLHKVDSLLGSNPYIKSHRVFKTMDGVLCIRLRQRAAVVHILDTLRGYDFYVDSSSTYLLQRVEGYTPKVITLHTDIDFDVKSDFIGKLDEINSKKDIDNLKKLCNFVRYIEPVGFYARFIRQISVEQTSQGLEAQIIPTIAPTTVLLGTIDDAEQKLSNLELFYRRAYRYASLDSVKEVDLRFNDQIVVRRGL